MTTPQLKTRITTTKRCYTSTAAATAANTFSYYYHDYFFLRLWLVANNWVCHCQCTANGTAPRLERSPSPVSARSVTKSQSLTALPFMDRLTINPALLGSAGRGLALSASLRALLLSLAVGTHPGSPDG